MCSISCCLPVLTVGEFDEALLFKNALTELLLLIDADVIGLAF